MTHETQGWYWIPVENKDALIARMDVLVKRAEKLGCEAPSLTWGTTKLVEVKPADGLVPALMGTYIEVMPVGNPPRFNGWRLVARIEHAGDNNVFYTVPGESCTEAFRHVKPVCAHCQKDWLVRKDTFVVAHDDGRYLQVGSNCLADFLGHQAPENITSLYTMFTTTMAGLIDEHISERGYRCDEVRKVRDILLLTSRVIKMCGWVSRAMSDMDETKVATISNVWRALSPAHSDYDREFQRDLREVEADEELVNNAIMWVQAQQAGESDYINNLRAIVDNGTVTDRSMGMLCSLLSAYQRTMSDAKPATVHVSQHVGEEGERITLDVEVYDLKYIDGAYGTVVLHKMKDEAGNLLSWFCSGSELGKGKFKVTGTVKEHGEYQGHKQTTLTRVKEAK